VILALLTVALVAGLAAAAVGDLGVAMDQVTGRHDQAQARQLARGAVDWARNVLAEDARGSTVDHLGEAWAVQVPPTPVEEGELAGEIRELSGRVNLNNLVQLDGPDALEIEQFQRLLAASASATPRPSASPPRSSTGSTPTTSRACPAAPNPAGTAPRRRPAGPPTAPSRRSPSWPRSAASARRSSPASPLRRGPARRQPDQRQHRPGRGAGRRGPGLGLDTARVLVAERGRAWFKDVADFEARLKSRSPDANPDISRLATTSRHFLVTGRARFGVAMVRMEVLLDRSQNWPTIVWQKLL
jgi:general secretion pathway protein K